jgi:hypothetical protein
MAAGKNVDRWLGEASLAAQREEIDLSGRFGIDYMGTHPLHHSAKSSSSRPARGSIQQALQLGPAKPASSISGNHIVLQLPLIPTRCGIQQRPLYRRHRYAGLDRNLGRLQNSRLVQAHARSGRSPDRRVTSGRPLPPRIDQSSAALP